MNDTSKQSKNRKTDHLKPWQYKKGQSGNPRGRPKGAVSMKEYLKKKLEKMTDKEREEYLEGIDKKIIWEMAEGKPQTNTDLTSGGEKFNIIDDETKALINKALSDL